MKAQEKADLLFSHVPVRGIKTEAPPLRLRALRDVRGFTLLELMLVTAILAILTAIFIPILRQYQITASTSRAMSDVRTIETGISAYFIDQHSNLPPNLDKIGFGLLLDPWGSKYVYDPAGTRKNLGFDLNDDYDLYSEGPNATSLPSINADESLDDILRADNGNFVGLASNYGL